MSLYFQHTFIPMYINKKKLRKKKNTTKQNSWYNNTGNITITNKEKTH